MTVVRRSARIKAQRRALPPSSPNRPHSSPPTSPPPTQQGCSPPLDAPPPPPPPLLAGWLWLVALGVIGGLALRSAVVAATRATAVVAPPCHVAFNPSHLVPCATFADLNRIFAYLAPAQASVEDAPLPPQFFTGAHLRHIQDQHIDRQWRQYYSYRLADTVAVTLQYDPTLQRHLAQGRECATSDLLSHVWRWVRSSADRTTDSNCGQASLALAKEQLLLLLDQWKMQLQNDHIHVRDAALRAADARLRLEHHVQVMAVLDENNSSSEVMVELYFKRAEYAAWLVEGSRWTCRGQEYARAIAAMDRMRAGMHDAVDSAMIQAPRQRIAVHHTIASWITNASNAFRVVAEGAATREKACAEQHLHAALAYCTPVGFDAWAHSTNSTTFVLVNNGTMQYETTVGNSHSTCESLLDPRGKGCTTHPQRIWWAWHNQDNLSSIGGHSPTHPPPPHLAACAPLHPLTLSQHWSRHLWPPSTREARARLMKEKEHMGAKASTRGFALPWDRKAAGGRAWALPPWKGVIRVHRGWWSSQFVWH